MRGLTTTLAGLASSTTAGAKNVAVTLLSASFPWTSMAMSFGKLPALGHLRFPVRCGGAPAAKRTVRSGGKNAEKKKGRQNKLRKRARPSVGSARRTSLKTSSVAATTMRIRPVTVMRGVASHRRISRALRARTPTDHLRRTVQRPPCRNYACSRASCDEMLWPPGAKAQPSSSRRHQGSGGAMTAPPFLVVFLSACAT